MPRAPARGASIANSVATVDYGGVETLCRLDTLAEEVAVGGTVTDERPKRVVLDTEVGPRRFLAEALGLTDRLGAIEPGKCADLILVDRDPLDDIVALKSVSWVMQHGKAVPRSPEWDRRPIKNPIGL